MVERAGKAGGYIPQTVPVHICLVSIHLTEALTSVDAPSPDNTIHVYIPGWKGARDYAQFRGISAVFRVITRQSRVVFAFSRPNTVRTRVISPINGRETARKRSDNINTFYVLFAPAREFIRETA